MSSGAFLKEKFLILAYDHGLEHGPKDFSAFSALPENILNLAKEGRFSAIVLTAGIALNFYSQTSFPPLILKLNGKTNFFKKDPLSLAFSSIELALKLKAKAVGYTLYPGSKYESLMFQEFGRIREKAHQNNLKVVAWIYPRGQAIKNDTHPEVVKYAARIGLELGADIIKIKYPSFKNFKELEKTFSEIRRLAPKIKIGLAGGKKIEDEKFLKLVALAIKSGLNGIVVGRNVWQRKNPLNFSKKLAQIIFKS